MKIMFIFAVRKIQLQIVTNTIFKTLNKSLLTNKVDVAELHICIVSSNQQC
jgi:hypothetical protein